MCTEFYRILAFSLATKIIYFIPISLSSFSSLNYKLLTSIVFPLLPSRITYPRCRARGGRASGGQAKIVRQADRVLIIVVQADSETDPFLSAT